MNFQVARAGARLRRERPVAGIEGGGMMMGGVDAAWLLTRYDEFSEVVLDTVFRMSLAADHRKSTFWHSRGFHERKGRLRDRESRRREEHGDDEEGR